MITYQQLFSNTIKEPSKQSLFRLTMPNQDYPFQCIAESVELSFRNTAFKQRIAQGRNFNYADFSNLDMLNVVFYETKDMSVKDYINKWKLLIYNPITGVFGPPKLYERTITVEVLDEETAEVVQTMEYRGAAPADTAPITISYEDANGRVQITQSFAVKELVEI